MKAPDITFARAGRARGTTPRYSTVLGALGRDEVRNRVLARFKAQGGNGTGGALATTNTWPTR